MRAEVKSVSSNDTVDWDRWSAPDPSNVLHWFTVGIGPEGEQCVEFFQLPIATRKAVDQRADKHRPFKGLVLDPFEKADVEPLVRRFVAQITGSTWDEIEQQLRKTMISEYE